MSQVRSGMVGMTSKGAATSEQILDAASVIDRSRVSGAQMLILGIIFFISMFDGYDTQAIAYVAPLMAHDLGFSPTLLGPIFSSGYAGLTLGAFLFGTLADKIGRKQAILWPMAIFGLFSLATPFGHTVESLVILRFLAGCGLGGILPNAGAYILEYSPRRLQSLLINGAGAFFAAGSIVGGLLANLLIPTYGWQWTFYVGGSAPLLFIVVAGLYLPESIRFLLLSGRKNEQVVAIMRRIVPGRNFAAGTRFTLERRLPGVTIKHLFTDGRAYPTVLLWIGFFMTLFIVLYLINWMPTLLRQAGQPLSIAIKVTIMYSVGAIVGSCITGWIADRVGSMPKVLACAYLGASLLLVIVAFSIANIAVLMPVAFLIGCTIVSGQSCLNTISATYYPTAIRGTGIGWGLGVGRVGGVIGPFVGGVLIGANLSVSSVILATIIPAVIGTIAIWLFHFRYAAGPAPVPMAVPVRSTKAVADPAVGGELPGRAPVKPVRRA